MAQVENAKDSKQVIVNLTMTVDDARQVIWQDLYHPQEPIGKLLDSKQLKYGNLCWAVEGARTQEMRAASRTLLAYWVGEPATLEATRRYGPEVVSGSRYLEEKEIESLRWGMLWRGYGFGAGVGMIVISVQQLSTTKSVLAWLISLAFGLGVLGIILGRWSQRELNRFKNLRQGRQGELAVVEELRATLDSRWAIFRNLQLPDRKDDIDIALVGPGGVWALEVKAFRETVRVANGTWERQTKRGWKRLDKNPSKQVTDNAVRLNRFLQQQGINRWVEKRVILSELQEISNFEHAEDVWILPQVEDKAANLSTRTPPTEDETKRIVGLFRDLATKQVAAEEAKYKK
jgi:hypothetical protein